MVQLRVLALMELHFRIIRSSSLIEFKQPIKILWNTDSIWYSYKYDYTDKQNYKLYIDIHSDALCFHEWSWTVFVWILWTRNIVQDEDMSSNRPSIIDTIFSICICIRFYRLLPKVIHRSLLLYRYSWEHVLELTSMTCSNGWWAA